MREEALERLRARKGGATPAPEFELTGTVG
jgi:hypothetical protein